MAVLAAPLVIPFAEAVGLSVAILGMDKAADKVNQYIKDNPEESMKILSNDCACARYCKCFEK